MNPFLSKKIRFFNFISIVLVVFIHGYNLHNRYLQPWTTVNEPLTINAFTQYFFANGIFRFMIPMLFAISGYLFALHDNQPYGNRIGKRAKTLLLPYFLWSFIGLLIAVVFTFWPVTKSIVYQTHLQPIDKPFTDYKITDWLLAALWPTSFQLWFLRCLFMYNLLYPLLLKGLMKFPAILFAVFCLLWLGTFGIVLIEGEGLLFFSLGVWLCKTRKDIENKPRWLNPPVCALIFISASFLKTWLAFHVTNFNFGTFLLLSVLHKTTVITGLVTAWFSFNPLVTFFMSRNWFVKTAAFTFIIYALHVPLITYLIDPAFSLINNFPHYRLVTFIFLPLVIIVFCIMVGWILRKAVPKAYTVLTGGRGI